MLGLPAVEADLLRPVQQPTDVRVLFDYDQMVSRAMVQRTELQRQAVKVRQQSLRLVAAKNFLLPQLDFIGRYRLRGLGDDLTGGGPRFSSTFKTTTPSIIKKWNSVSRWAWRSVAAKLMRPYATRRGNSNANKPSWNNNNAVSRVKSATQSRKCRQASTPCKAPTAQWRAARERLESSESLYRADKLQIEFLLDAQEELARVELQHAADQSRYALSLVNIHNVTGQLLAESGIYIPPPGAR